MSPHQRTRQRTCRPLPVAAVSRNGYRSPAQTARRRRIRNDGQHRPKRATRRRVAGSRTAGGRPQPNRRHSPAARLEPPAGNGYAERQSRIRPPERHQTAAGTTTAPARSPESRRTGASRPSPAPARGHPAEAARCGTTEAGTRGRAAPRVAPLPHRVQATEPGPERMHPLAGKQTAAEAGAGQRAAVHRKADRHSPTASTQPSPTRNGYSGRTDHIQYSRGESRGTRRRRPGQRQSDHAHGRRDRDEEPGTDKAGVAAGSARILDTGSIENDDDRDTQPTADSAAAVTAAHRQTEMAAGPPEHGSARDTAGKCRVHERIRHNMITPDRDRIRRHTIRVSGTRATRDDTGCTAKRPRVRHVTLDRRTHTCRRHDVQLLTQQLERDTVGTTGRRTRAHAPCTHGSGRPWTDGPQCPRNTYALDAGARPAVHEQHPADPAMRGRRARAHANGSGPNAQGPREAAPVKRRSDQWTQTASRAYAARRLAVAGWNRLRGHTSAVAGPNAYGKNTPRPPSDASPAGLAGGAGGAWPPDAYRLYAQAGQSHR